MARSASKPTWLEKQHRKIQFRKGKLFPPTVFSPTFCPNETSQLKEKFPPNEKGTKNMFPFRPPEAYQTSASPTHLQLHTWRGWVIPARWGKNYITIRIWEFQDIGWTFPSKKTQSGWMMKGKDHPFWELPMRVETERIQIPWISFQLANERKTLQSFNCRSGPISSRRVQKSQHEMMYRWSTCFCFTVFIAFCVLL